MRSGKLIHLRTPRSSTAEHFANHICDRVRQSGGEAWAGWALPCLVVRIKERGPGILAAACREIEDSALQRNISLFLLQTEGVQVAGLDATCFVPWGTVIHQKLSKRLITALPSGATIVVPRRNGRRADLPKFIAKIGQETSERIWGRALSEKAAYRVCRILWQTEW